MHRVLSNYPLSLPYRTSLERKFGALEYLTVSEMRQIGIGSMVRKLWGVRGGVLSIAFEDDTSRALLPVLVILASISRAKSLQVVDDGMDTTAVGRWSGFVSGVKLAIESARASIALWSAGRELRRLGVAAPLLPRPTANPRVAYLNCNLWFGVKAGGSVGHISGVANALMDLGHPVDFYSVGGRLLVDDRATFHALPPPRMLAMPFEATYYRFDGTCEQAIRRDFDRAVPGFIYQRMSIGNFTGVRLSRAYGIPLVLEYNGSEAWIAKNWGRPLRFHEAAVAAEDACLRHAHTVVTVSDVLGDELRARGVPSDRIVVYPNCIDPGMFDPSRFSADQLASLRAQFGFAVEDIVATFVGTFGQWHGVDVLAQAVRRLIDEDREFLDRHRLRFLLVGDGLKMNQVKQFLAGAEQGPYVRLAGLVPQTEAPKYLAASDILLSPHVKNPDGTAFFGSPTKLFEYLAMGKGIVASDLDQLGEVLRPAVEVNANGELRAASEAVAMLVPPGDVTALCAGIKRLAEDAPLRAALGSRARSLALSKYTWRHHTQAIIDGLERVVGRGP